MSERKRLVMVVTSLDYSTGMILRQHEQICYKTDKNTHRTCYAGSMNSGKSFDAIFLAVVAF
jgi:hypothetical protein